MTQYDFDLFVIGAGSGGVRAARIAAGHGARVAIAEADRFGGTCVIRGCVPKKLLVYASRFRDEFEDAGGFGWRVPQPVFDWPSLIAAKDKEIARLEGIYRSNLEKAGVTVFAARAEFAGPNSVTVAGTPSQVVTAERILIATGGSPNLGDAIPGDEFVITSNEAFHLPQMPRRILIQGGGYIAVEFAGIFHGLGAETTLVYRRNKILRGFEEDMRDGLMEAYANKGIRVVTGRTIASIEASTEGYAARLDDGQIIEADQVMYAVGRSPNTAGLKLPVADIETRKNGAIIVDGNSRTNVPSVYAVGDVTDRVNLTPVAIREGHAFADTVYGNKPWSAEYDFIPSAVFSTPEIGTVGLDEVTARDPKLVAAKFPSLAGLGGAVDIYKARFRTMKATLSGRDERMLMKLVVDSGTGRVLGCHILGPDAAEIVQVAAIAMRMGATKADFDRTMPLHPSVAEELVTLREKWKPPA